MALQKFSYNIALAWIGVFLCTLIAQLSLTSSTAKVPSLSDSQKNLIQNAVVPVFLSENPDSAIRQLENLIQDTDIRQIRVYTADQQLVAQVLNSSVPAEARLTQIDNMSIVFQGNLAGSVQLDSAYAEIEETVFEDGLQLLLKSLAISLAAWLVFHAYWYARKVVLPNLHTSKRNPGILEAQADSPQETTASSLLLYIYPQPDPMLIKDKTAHRDCMQSFYRKLEDHLRIYGGRILSLSNDRIICRMARGQSQNDMQQAFTFCWGIARPLIYRSDGNQYQLEIRSLLHKTTNAARSGQLYRAISEIDADMEIGVQKSAQGAHVSSDFLSGLGSTDFDYQRSRENPDLYLIRSVKKSVDRLWQKQESIVASQH